MQFGVFPEEYRSFERAKVVILPVPYDGTSTWIKGADRGPAALLAASQALEMYDIETDSEVYRQGIYTDAPLGDFGPPEEMVAAVKKRVAELLSAGKFVVIIGGEHTVSLGGIFAYAERFSDLSVLQLDAHADMREVLRGSRFNHGCVMARVREVCPCVQVGIRSLDISEKPSVFDHDVFFAQDIAGADESWMAEAVNRLSANVYVTVDLDVFDPAVVPSTGTPEPGGLQWYPVLKLLRHVVQTRRLVGFDIVELCPQPYNHAPEFLAAKLLYKVLSYKFHQDSSV